MALNKSDAETIAYILTKKAKHRASQPFFNELISYLTHNESDKPYYFLSDGDYRMNYLVPTGDKSHPYKLTVDSQNTGVLSRIEDANAELLKLSFV